MLNKDVSRRQGERLSVRISVPKTALGALLSLPFVAVCGVLLTASLTNLTDESVGRSAFEWLMVALGSSIQLIFGLVGAVFFGYAFVFFSIRLLLFWRPAFEVGPEGILDRASALGAGFVPWEIVKDVKLSSTGGQQFISITVKDEQRFLERQSFPKRMAMRTNRRYFTGALINVSDIILPVSQQRMLAEIKPHLNLPAQRRLARFQIDETASRETGEMVEAGDSRSTSARTAIRLAFGVLRWLWATTLTLFFVMTGSMLGLFGAIVGWSGLRALFGLGSGQGEWWHAPVGLAMMIFGLLLIFRWMDPIVRKLSGREPV
ncbi:MAG: STM3941 family protein [Rubrobacteraceae bacterium]